MVHIKQSLDRRIFISSQITDNASIEMKKNESEWEGWILELVIHDVSLMTHIKYSINIFWERKINIGNDHRNFRWSVAEMCWNQQHGDVKTVLISIWNLYKVPQMLWKLWFCPSYFVEKLKHEMVFRCLILFASKISVQSS